MSILNIAEILRIQESITPEFPLDLLAPGHKKKNSVAYIDEDGEAKIATPGYYFTVPLLKIDDIETKLLDVVLLASELHKENSTNLNNLIAKMNLRFRRNSVRRELSTILHNETKMDSIYKEVKCDIPKNHIIGIDNSRDSIIVVVRGDKKGIAILDTNSICRGNLFPVS